ncbi:MAG TPA: His-Xaa-Ser system protein HxsD [Kofleriaceae bacterium]|nr:His-Xaa-Ser system protein HxsD [Kofleriaceae bacterium]
MGDGDRELTFEDGAVRVVFDLRVYRQTAIQKAAYRFADRFTAVLGARDGHALAAALQFKPTTSAATAREAVRQFYQELLDQELREQIADETTAVRTLILAHAFSNVDLIKRDA